MRIVEFVFIEIQQRQGVMNPKELMVPVERGPDSEGCLEMVCGFLCLALGTIYVAEDTVGLTELKFLAFVWEE